MRPGPLRVLIVYRGVSCPTRDAILHHIYCYRKYSGHRVFFLNMHFKTVPGYIRSIDWDVVVFHNTYLICRAAKTVFDLLNDRLSFLKDRECLKIITPQDDANNSQALCDFIRSFGVRIVYCCIHLEEDRRKIYQGVPRSVQIIPSLTGYVDDRMVAKFAKQATQIGQRDIEVGYRSFKAKARNGRLGVLKWRIAEVFDEACRRHGLKSDISVDLADVLTGADWIRFLARSRYQIGVESGSSLLDPDGSIMRSCNRYEAEHPDASFEEIESHCFSGLDERINGAAIGPRVFEAAMARSCQILVEGEHSGILQKDLHYIPVKKDFSNVDDVVLGLGNEERRVRIVEAAYRDLILSRRYHYDAYVAAFFETALAALDHVPRPDRFRDNFCLVWNRLQDWINWQRLPPKGILGGIVKGSTTTRTVMQLMAQRLRRVFAAIGPNSGGRKGST